MDNNYCDITAILDRSGSMSSIKNDTIGGFNTFLDEQKKTPGKALMTLVQFDDAYQVDYAGVPIESAPQLTENSYVPRGFTALLDAVGKTITSVGERLAKLPENERPGKVVILIITDGMENASTEYTGQRILEMVKHQTEAYKWEFVYIGANVDAFAESGKIGVNAHNAYAFTATGQGIRAAYSGLAASTTSFRVGAKSSMAFTEEEKTIIDSGK